jgi:hypothetical protein
VLQFEPKKNASPMVIRVVLETPLPMHCRNVPYHLFKTFAVVWVMRMKRKKEERDRKKNVVGERASKFEAPP